MENDHFRAIIQDKIQTKYPLWKKIFTQAELADTTTEQ
jgi:hypothetical protein